MPSLEQRVSALEAIIAAGKPISALSAATGAQVADDDLFAITDVSTGTNKKLQAHELANYLGTAQLQGAGGDGTVASKAKTDGTDQYSLIRAELDMLEARTSPAAKMLRLPAGRIKISHPLVLFGQSMGLIGDPTLQTTISPNYGSGYAVVVRPRRAGPTTGATLYTTGGGTAMRLGSTLPFLDLSSEQNTDLRALTTFTFQCRFKPLNLPGLRSCIVNSQILLGSSFLAFISWAVWVTNDGALAIYWNNTPYTTATGLIAVNTNYHVAFVFNGPGNTVKVFLNGTQVLSIAAGVSTVPQTAQGVEVTTVGDNVTGPSLGTWGFFGLDGWVDGIEFDDRALYTGSFTAPTAKSSVSSHTLLLINDFTSDPDFVVGKVGNRSAPTDNAFFLPVRTTETQGTGYVVKNLYVEGAFGASGFYGEDCFNSTWDNLAILTYCGFKFIGSTYESNFSNFTGLATSYGLVITGAAAGIDTSSVNIRSGAIGVFLEGAVGGRMQDLLFTTLPTTLINFYVGGTNDVTFVEGRIDDEGAGTGLLAAVVANNAAVKFNGGQVLVTKPGTMTFECALGGCVQLDGTSFVIAANTAEVCRFRDPPSIAGSINNLTYYSADPPPFTLTPSYVHGAAGFTGVTTGVSLPRTLLAVESGATFSSQRPGAATYANLPSAAVGLEYNFFVESSQGWTVVAAAGDRIVLAGNMTAPAGTISTTSVGYTLNLKALDNIRWLATIPDGSATLGGSTVPATVSAAIVAWYDHTSAKWTDTSRTTAATADGASVAVWDDVWTRGNHLAQATAANRPTLKLSLQNGKDVVRFDGVNDWLEKLAPAGFTGETGQTILVVASRTGSPSFGMMVVTEPGGARELRWNFSGTTPEATINNTAATLDYGSTVSGWHEYDFIFDDANNLSTITVDATSPVSAADSTDITGRPSDRIDLGARNGANFFAGDIAAVIVCNRPLTNAERDALRLELKTSYGTP